MSWDRVFIYWQCVDCDYWTPSDRDADIHVDALDHGMDRYADDETTGSRKAEQLLTGQDA
jgi:hypothetical protein